MKWTKRAVVAWVGVAAVTAWGAVLDVERLERDVRADVRAFRVATGAVEAALPAEAVAEMGTGELLGLARALQEGDEGQALALYGELARRELSWEERVAALSDVLARWAEFPPREDWRAAAEAFGLPVWEAWSAGGLPAEQRRKAYQPLLEFAALEQFSGWLAGNGSEERSALWQARMDGLTGEMAEVLGKGGKAPDGDDGAADRQAGTAAVAAGSASPGSGEEPGSEAEWRLRRGVELSMLGRNRDAAAEFLEGARVAEAAGEEELLRELRAALALYGDWGWRRVERRALCAAEIAAGSPWKEPLLAAMEEEVEIAWGLAEAMDLALAGWLEYGSGEWAARVGALVCKGGGLNLARWHRACGKRLEAVPAREERREALRALVELRWAMGELFPGRVEASLEEDLARLRERAAEAAASGEADGEEPPAPEAVPMPGERWRAGEPSWRSDPSVPEIEREFNAIAGSRAGSPDAPARWFAWRMWRKKWSLEERRALRVDGVGAEFASLADEFGSLWAWEEEKAVGLAALAECKVQEGYDGRRLLGVLSGLLGRAVAGNPPTAEEAAEITEWSSWARQVARGDAEEEDRLVLLELERAELLGDEAAVRRLAGGTRSAASLCEWGYSTGRRELPWKVLARRGGVREAARLAILHTQMCGDAEPGDAEAVAALMDVMTAGELEALREARRLRVLAVEAGPEGMGPLLPFLAERLGHGRVRGWWNGELQLRLARLEAQGADSGAEGQAAAEALGTGSVRGVLSRLRWRLGGGTEAGDGTLPAPKPPEADAGRTAGGAEDGGGVREEDGRWREWCACVREFAGNSNRDGGRWVPGWTRCGDHRVGAILPPWLDLMVQRGLQEALSAWGAEATEEERAGIAAALEGMGTSTGEAVYGDWLRAAEGAGTWAAEALERGRAAEPREEEIEIF